MDLEPAKDEFEREMRKERKARKKLLANLGDIQTTLSAASHMLTKFGVDTEPLRRMCEGDFGEGGGGKAPTYVWIPSFLDPFDGKSFQTAEHLKRYMFAHHAAEIRVLLPPLCGGEGKPPPPLPSLERVRESGAVARDACEAASMAAVERLGSNHTVTRHDLLAALKRLRDAPEECNQYHLLEPRDGGHTVHDFLAYDDVAANSAADGAVLLDWRAVDAHLRTLRRVFLLT